MHVFYYCIGTINGNYNRSEDIETMKEAILCAESFDDGVQIIKTVEEAYDLNIAKLEEGMVV